MFTMALNREVAERLLNKIDNLQKQIEEIHNELLVELDSDEISVAERKEIEAIKKENDYRTLEEWDETEIE